MVYYKTELNQLFSLSLQFKPEEKMFSNYTVSLHSTTKESNLPQLAQKGINALYAMTGEQDYLCLV